MLARHAVLAGDAPNIVGQSLGHSPLALETDLVNRLDQEIGQAVRDLRFTRHQEHGVHAQPSSTSMPAHLPGRLLSDPTPKPFDP